MNIFNQNLTFAIYYCPYEVLIVFNALRFFKCFRSRITLSVNSGFYTETIELTIDHPQSEVVILYSLDGSDPHLDNLNGKSWNYKSYYPLFPGDDFGEIHRDTIWTYQYNEPPSSRQSD